VQDAINPLKFDVYPPSWSLSRNLIYRSTVHTAT
jgi:hypothetical protein